MVFSSAVFLYFFLPIVLGLYYVLAHRFRNLLLLVASLIFYAWGEPEYLTLMILSILFNWTIGLAMARAPGRRSEFAILSVGVTVDVLVLIYYKYAFFLVSNLNEIIAPFLHRTIPAHQIPLPIGISFFTFHAISYIVDIYRREAQALRNPLNMGLYISLFPQLIAGPIIRYHDVADQILHRSNTLERFSSGVERFVYGLGKKVLIANVLGQVADQAFSTPAGSLSAGTAWLGIVCYTLQIYFDFSGYSDMAIGLARMFGFELTENFNYPYISRSVREFWRRWHISLSTWFRDYVYIPLGGNRASSMRVRINLFVVFLLCGLWHGASWNFAFWGAFHGGLLVLERGPFGKTIDRVPRLIGSAYTLLMVAIGWVFFRAADFHEALVYLRAMFGGAAVRGFTPQMALFLNSQTYVALAFGILLSTPVVTFLARDWKSRRFPYHSNEPLPAVITSLAVDQMQATVLSTRTVAVIVILLMCSAQLAASTYNPFIYFRF
ncbi:alginate O-acetyltransferase complex protein AlgI [Paraburkholderia sp. GAS333]|uniref:MBOAT family O-acyltransferase n=1 Tax=Paraburkholderia sp. GAS333 TaxID=3156279 RepID=UPI003D216999